jgi:hypothetical protein
VENTEPLFTTCIEMIGDILADYYMLYGNHIRSLLCSVVNVTFASHGRCKEIVFLRMGSDWKLGNQGMFSFWYIVCWCQYHND